MKSFCRVLFIFLLSPVMVGCAYFDTEEVQNPDAAQGVETINLMAGDHGQMQQNVRDIVYDSTGGSVQIFDLSGDVAHAAPTGAEEDNIVSTIDTAGIDVKEVQPVQTALPGGYILSSEGTAPKMPLSMDPSVDVFSVE